MQKGAIWAAALLLAVFCFGLGACDDDATAPTANTPINGLEFQQFGADSLLVTFNVTVAINSAELYVRDMSLTSPPYELAATLQSNNLRQFRIRWPDWFSTNAGGYIMVRVYYGTSGRYSWTEFFKPS